ncbi:MAG: NUDIX hydrolase [Fimbriimonas sp.]
MRNVSAGAVILNGRGEVLLVRQTYGVQNWEIPGGAGEPDESPVQTALREVVEETGLRVRAVATTGWYYDPALDKLGGVFLCELEEDADREPVPNGTDVSECRYWPTDALPRPISDWTILRIADALKSPGAPLPTVIGPRVWFDAAD